MGQQLDELRVMIRTDDESYEPVDLKPDEFWVSDVGEKIIKASVLEGLAEQYGESVPDPEFVNCVVVGMMPIVAFKCKGTSKDGRMINVIGEASPNTCKQGDAYLHTMAHKRAMQRWILRALDLKDVYSSDEFLMNSNNEMPNVYPQQHNSQTPPQDSQVSMPSDLDSYVIPIGRFKGKTVAEALAGDKSWIPVLLKTWKPKQTNREHVVAYNVLQQVAIREGLA